MVYLIRLHFLKMKRWWVVCVYTYLRMSAWSFHLNSLSNDDERTAWFVPLLLLFAIIIFDLNFNLTFQKLNKNLVHMFRQGP